MSEVLSKLCLTMYSWEELQKRPLPDGVDPLRLECYLVDEEFEVPADLSFNSMLSRHLLCVKYCSNSSRRLLVKIIFGRVWT